MKTGLEILKETCLKLNLPPFTKSVAVSIFKRTTATSNMKRLCQTCVSLACKITEFPLDRKNTIDGNLEMKIAEGINFEFDPFDVYAFMRTVYASINTSVDEEKLQEKLEEKLEEEDCIFSREKCIEVGMKLMKEEEAERFKNLHCLL